MESSQFPLRINRYLALKGLGTRRGMDELIKKRRITINGRVALLGDVVNKDDVVEIIKTKHDREKKLTYVAYYKPVGVITQSPNPLLRDGRDETRAPSKSDARKRPGNARQQRMSQLQKGKHTATDTGSPYSGLFPVGRLDKDSSGLLILTNDGRITDRLLNPVHDHEKEYIVEVDKKLTPHILRILERGVDIEGYRTKPSRTVFVNDTKFRITLSEGKKHQIRRMTAALGLQVRSLKRERVMNIKLSSMKQGEMREITGDELAQFLKSLWL